MKLGKHVANPNWIQECAKLGAWLPENKFPVGLEKKPKTQSSSSMKSEADEKSKNENNKLIEEQIAKNVIREDQLYLSINRIKILKIFQGFTFAIYGIDDANRLKKIISLILFSGAKYLSDGLLNVTHILVGEKFSEKKMEELEREHPGIKLMKLVWLYDSISSQSLIDPVVFLWRFTPKSSNENALPTDWNSSKKLKTGNEMRIPEILKGKVVCVSEYVDAERDEVKTLTEKLGGIYTERLSMKDPKVNFLICKSKETEKAKKAIAWNIPIYDLTWLRSHFLPPAFN